MKTATPTLFFLLILIPFSFLKAQEDGEMHTLAGSICHSGGYGALLFKSTEFRDKSMVLVGGRGAWVINRVFGIGFEANGVLPINTYEGIDPDGYNNAFLVGGYGGLVLEPVLMSNKLIHVNFPVTAGAGWLGYVRDWEATNYHPGRNDLYDQDIFWYLEPGISIELNVTRFFRADIGVTKRFVQDLQLVDTGSSDLSKPSFSLALKFGRF
jgi:hypothetical protein